MFKTKHRRCYRLSTVPKCTHVLLVLAVLEEGLSPLPSLAFSCSSHCHWWPLWKLFLSHWNSTALYKTVWSCVFPWGNRIRNHFRRPSLCSGHSLLSCASACSLSSPTIRGQDTQGQQVMVSWRNTSLSCWISWNFRMAEGFWGQAAASERICSAQGRGP